MNGWQHLDAQMSLFQDRPTDAIKLSPEVARKLATNIAADIRFLSPSKKSFIRDSSPISIGERLSELQAFQGWVDWIQGTKSNPYLVHAQVLTQNYICFVYLPEACFRALAKYSASGSATKKCAKFLIDNPVRAFRNAIAHANWKYRSDFAAITFWSRKGSDPDGPLEEFEVEQSELNFWQALSRCVAYVCYSNV
jgi:hypothetical protein